MHGYIEQVVRYAEEQRALAEADRTCRCRPLHLKIQDWWNPSFPPARPVRWTKWWRNSTRPPA